MKSPEFDIIQGMDRNALRQYCLAKPGTKEELPFGPDTLVFKVMGKIFALCENTFHPESVNLKCDPDDALFFRSQFEGVRPGYHMNKKHWNTVSLIGDVPESLVREMIDDSYDLVVAGLPAKLKTALAAFIDQAPPE